jgi:ABC-type amino acid transport substrate-binding protein
MHSDLRRLFALLAMLAACASARAQPVPEHELKAAFVYNFAVFTEWPQEALAASAPIVLCTGSASSLSPALQSLNDKVVNGHKLAVRPASAGLRACHVLVLGSGDRERWAQIKRDLAGTHVLTVSDDLAISQDGAMIALSMVNQRVGFDVDIKAAKSARLQLSSKLLRLARSVQ